MTGRPLDKRCERMPAGGGAIVSVTVLVALLVLVVAPFTVQALRVDIYTFPEAWNLGLRAPIDDWQSSIIANRESLAMFQYFFDPLSAFIDAGLRWAEIPATGVPIVHASAEAAP